MKEVFASARISEKTRARVKTNREQQIESQHFRRKISNQS
jgi:hypothetical protein